LFFGFSHRKLILNDFWLRNCRLVIAFHQTKLVAFFTALNKKAVGKRSWFELCWEDALESLPVLLRINLFVG